MSQAILVGKGKQPCQLLAQMANRHGLIAGATGTGKTVTLRVLAEGFSSIGVPVFMADVKGDLAGMALAAPPDPKLQARAQELGVENYASQAAPVVFWDTLAAQGIPVRATISDMGPLLLGRLLNLNETQNGVLSVVFKAADEQGMLLLDLKDLQAMLQHVGENAKEFSTAYGNVSSASIAAIQRGLLTLGEQGADKFFGEPMLDINDLLRVDAAGHGVVNILAAEKLIALPKLYATFLLWLLADLYERLPEVGDIDRPKLVFFFDEAHLLFDSASKVVLEKVEQVVRLIRSKGVGVYFVSQNPLDIPDTVLGQLGNRVQHALRAFTPRDQKAVKAAAQTFRSDGSVDVERAITELAVGEALVSLLDESGSPLPVDRAKIVPPRSRLGAIADDEREKIKRQSPLFSKYQTAIDRESAYENMRKRRGRADRLPVDRAEPRDGAVSGSKTKPSTFWSKLAATASAVWGGCRWVLNQVMMTVRSALRFLSTRQGQRLVEQIIVVFSGQGSRRGSAGNTRKIADEHSDKRENGTRRMRDNADPRRPPTDRL